MSHPVGSPHRRRILASIAIAVALTLALSGAAVEGAMRPAAAAPADDEAAFISAINQSRGANGLGGLSTDAAAANVARAWSGQMAGENLLHHNPNLRAEVEAYVTTAWQRLGENVGVGYSVSSLHDAFMASAGHRANILGDYNRVGVGVVREPSGRIWVTVVFIKGPALAPPAPVGSSPVGSVDMVMRVPGALRITGWVLDPDTVASSDVHVYIGGTGRAVRADRDRPDIAAAFPGYGGAHGFDVTIPVLPGVQDLCVYGINAAGGGGTSVLSCRPVSVQGTPGGAIDAVSWALGTITVSGWALDPDVEWPIAVHVYVDGVGASVSASAPRPDIAAVFPGYGAGHGFSATSYVGGGRHTVCAYGIGAGLGGNALLGCRVLDTPTDPRGALDAVSRVPGGIQASGWALDPETAQPIAVHVYAGPVGQPVSASANRPDIAVAFPGYGDRHGFQTTVPTGDGPVQVCAYGIGVGAGGNSLLGCRVV